tara:strand:- start:108 stop:314 length:207 start_codon:yes stop_codon:yes gene_type:complete
MLSTHNLYLFFLSILFILLLYIFLNSRSNKNNIDNKILLKNLLEGFDLEIPEELKRLDKSSTDPQELS